MMKMRQLALTIPYLFLLSPFDRTYANTDRQRVNPARLDWVGVGIKASEGKEGVWWFSAYP